VLTLLLRRPSAGCCLYEDLLQQLNALFYDECIILRWIEQIGNLAGNFQFQRGPICYTHLLVAAHSLIYAAPPIHTSLNRNR
jgi:hypothetical protein